MWEKLKALSQHPAARAVHAFCGDPVQLYSVFLIMSVMYYYHEDFTWLYTLLALGMSFVLNKFYDFVAKRRFLGPVCYIVFMALGFYLVGMLTNLGQQSYPISFMVWFLTPQSVVEFSPLYTISIYLLMVGFLTSTVYYFAKVRYRMVMQLVIMLIPLSFYAKENIHMPALLVILLLASFFLLMVYCRQLKPNEQVRQIGGLGTGASIAMYVAAFSVIAAIIPKPQFEADREFIDNAMSYMSWSDVLMKAISAFTDSTDNTVAVSNNARTIFYAKAPESLRLRTQTYSYYLADDSWNVIYEYDKPESPYRDDLTYQPRALTQAILDAAELDADFAETYNLADIAEVELPPQPLQEVTFVSTWYNTPGIPSPTRSTGVTAQSPGSPNVPLTNAKISNTNTISMTLAREMPTVQYYSDTYARYQAESNVLRRLHNDTYGELLDAAEDILAGSDPEAAEVVHTAAQEFAAAQAELAAVNAQGYHSDVIDDLAEEITAGLDNDLDKALAIERYFTEQGFVYDLSYTKPKGDNVDQFLSETHIGVCYEYATAMTLLCRSIGLPTRYVQGYNMGERYDTKIDTDQGTIELNYLIKMRDAHAFPEVYISGYGWVSFEPTVAGEEEVSVAENQNVMRWGYVLLVLTLLALGFWAILPFLREQRFRRRLPGMTPGQAASAAFCRMRRSLHLSDSTTVWGLYHSSEPFYAAQEVFSAMDVLLYNPTASSVMTARQLADSYVEWQARRKAYEKEQKKLRKEQKKAHVNV